MARQRKRCVTPFPTFCEEIPRKYNVPAAPPADAGALIPGMAGAKESTGPGLGRDDGSVGLDGTPKRPRLLALQLALERFDLFGQRNILAHQRLDLAHGVQHRGVIAPAEPAADFGQ